MDIHELANILNRMYEGAKRNEAVSQVTLFGIMYADEIAESGCTLKDLVQLSGLNMGYVTEVSKGIKLSQHVVPKKKEESNHEDS